MKSTFFHRLKTLFIADKFVLFSGTLICHLLFFSSCKQYHNHSLVAPNSPGFTAKGQVTGNVVMSSSGFQGQVAASLTDNFGISGNHLAEFGKKGRTTEFALVGFFRKKDYQILELSLGAGKGISSGTLRAGQEWYNNPKFDERINSNSRFRYIYIQPAYIMKWEKISVGIIDKINFITLDEFYQDYYNELIPNTYAVPEQADTIRLSKYRGVREDFLVEVKMKYFSHGFLIVQTGFSLNNFSFITNHPKNSKLIYNPWQISVGLQIRLDNLKRKSK
jgi:hypothetical protein